MQQLERRPRRLLLTDFPLLHRRDTGIQQPGKHRLADPCGLADLLDLFGLQRLDRGQAQLIEFAQRDLVHCAGFMQTLGRVERLRREYSSAEAGCG